MDINRDEALAHVFGEPTEIAEGITAYGIDTTPAGLKTPEGVRRVTKANEELEASTSAVANKASEFIDDLSDFVEVPRELLEDYRELKAMIEDRRNKQDAFLKALAGHK